MTVFEARNYIDYLRFKLDEKRGLRSELASFIGCQTGYISQILQSLSDLSLEQGMRVASFLKLSEDETHFFMLLLQLKKASTQELKRYFTEQVNQIKQQREEIKNRIKITNTFNPEDYHQYYSSWEYSAVHILSSIPEYQDKEAMARKLGLNHLRLNEVLSFLLLKGLVEESSGKLLIGPKRLHLAKDSPYINSHHQNWRLHAIRMLSDKNPINLNYSGVFSLSKTDIEKIREILMKGIVETEKVLGQTGEEEMIYLGIDLNVF